MNVPEGFSPSNILIIQLRQLGDVLLTTPVIEPIKRRFPNARISFLTEVNAYEILSGNPYLDEIITIKRKSSIPEQIKVIRDIRKKRFDLVIDFMANPKTAYISFFSGAAFTIAWNVRLRGLIYSMTVELIGDYAVDHKLSMLRPLGIEGGDRMPYLHVPGEADEKIKATLNSMGIGDKDFLVCVDATHRRITRKWTAEGFAEVADRMTEGYGAKVLFIWGPGEREEVEGIMAKCRHRHLISPGTTIKELAALLKRADLLIGNCSFPRHVAVSQGTPSLIIIGAPADAWKYPDPIHRTVKKGLPCQPCDKNVCSDLACLTTLTADEVMTEFKALLPEIKRKKSIPHSVERV